jgi:hypothetical protein
MPNLEIAKVVVREIAEARSLLETAQTEENGWERILAFPEFWSLRHDSHYSTKDMSDLEIQQSIIEDILFTKFEASANRKDHNGFPFTHYPLSQTTRHLGSRKFQDGPRIEMAIRELQKIGMIVENNNNSNLYIPEELVETAQDFCGVYHGVDEEPDAFDSLVQAGGLELATDTFKELLEEVEELETPIHGI